MQRIHAAHRPTLCLRETHINNIARVALDSSTLLMVLNQYKTQAYSPLPFKATSISKGALLTFAALRSR